MKTNPSTNSVSSIVPPSFFTTLMSLKSTLFSPLPRILKTASTAIGANYVLLAETTFEDKAVVTHSISDYLSSRSTLVLISSRNSIALLNAI